MNLFLALFPLLFASSDCTHVTLITIVIGQNPMYGLFSSGPVFDVALQTVAATFPDIFRNVTQHIVYKPKAISGCRDTGDMMFSVAAEVFQLIEQSRGFPVILSPGKPADSITDLILGLFKIPHFQSSFLFLKNQSFIETSNFTHIQFHLLTIKLKKENLKKSDLFTKKIRSFQKKKFFLFFLLISKKLHEMFETQLFFTKFISLDFMLVELRYLNLP
jgi:hypothetical protein